MFALCAGWRDFFPLLGGALGVLVFYVFPKEDVVSVY